MPLPAVGLADTVALLGPRPTGAQGTEYAGVERAYPDLWQNQEPRELPCYIANGTTGIAPDPAVAATCLNDQDPATNTPGSVDDPSASSPYYRFMSLFTRDTIRESVATWRVVNVLTTVMLLSAAVLLTAPRYRRAVTVGALVTATPTGLFLVSSIGPTAG